MHDAYERVASGEANLMKCITRNSNEMMMTTRFMSISGLAPSDFFCFDIPLKFDDDRDEDVVWKSY